MFEALRSESGPFSRPGLLEMITKQNDQAIAEINSDDEEHLLGVVPEQYADYLESKYRLHAPEIIEERERWRMEPVDHLLDYYTSSVAGYSTNQSKAVKIHVPFHGDKELFFWSPTTYSTSYLQPFAVNRQSVVLGPYLILPNPAATVEQALIDLGKIKQQLTWQQKDFDVHQHDLRRRIDTAIVGRREQVLHFRSAIAAIDIPLIEGQLSRHMYVPPTIEFRPMILDRPKGVKRDWKPEPTLSQNDYRKILEAIHGIGSDIEKYPGMHLGHGEETLRDSFLVSLGRLVKASVTGETFNKSGKTDILVKYQGDNLFVAECKNWHSPKEYLKAIDQLLGYLTWRDSKTALLIFVRDPEITNVLATALQTTRKHPNFVAEKSSVSESWTNYRFHLTGDPERELSLAVQLFHFPKASPTR